MKTQTRQAQMPKPRMRTTSTTTTVAESSLSPLSVAVLPAVTVATGTGVPARGTCTQHPVRSCQLPAMLASLHCGQSASVLVQARVRHVTFAWASMRCRQTANCRHVPMLHQPPPRRQLVQPGWSCRRRQCAHLVGAEAFVECAHDRAAVADDAVHRGLALVPARRRHRRKPWSKVSAHCSSSLFKTAQRKKQSHTGIPRRKDLAVACCRRRLWLTCQTRLRMTRAPSGTWNSPSHTEETPPPVPPRCRRHT